MTYREIINQLSAQMGRDPALNLVASLTGRSIATVSSWISREPPADTLELLIIKLRAAGHLGD